MKNKKIFGIPFVLFVAGLLVIGGATAVVVNYLSNTATAEVTVESPMTIQFAEVAHGDTVGDTINNVAITETWYNNIQLESTTGLGTKELGLKIVNNADFDIKEKWLELMLSNSINDVNCDDLSSMTFIDVGASEGTEEYHVIQELIGAVPCKEFVNGSVAYYVPIEDLGAGQTFKYPVTLTFANVAPADYSINAVLLNELPSWVELPQ